LCPPHSMEHKRLTSSTKNGIHDELDIRVLYLVYCSTA
jgi:hypothetical protein